jgi:hypothetical protein
VRKISFFFVKIIVHTSTHLSLHDLISFIEYTYIRLLKKKERVISNVVIEMILLMKLNGTDHEH